MTTANMGLTLVAEGTAQYTWATELNSNFIIIDSHNHSTNQGSQIAASAVNFLSNANILGNITGSNYIQFKDELILSSLSNSLFCYNGDLYFCDNSVRIVQITSGDSLYTPSESGNVGFTGDYVSAGAEAIYSSSPDTYTFTTDGTTVAILGAYGFTVQDFVSPIDNTSYAISFTTALISVPTADLSFGLPVSSSGYIYVKRIQV